jgi:hypothetical protein
MIIGIFMSEFFQTDDIILIWSEVDEVVHIHFDHWGRGG